MIQTLGKFTVAWEKRGMIHYACWFTHSSDYFKCVKGIRGAEVATHDREEYGIVTLDEYVPFGPWGEIDKTTQQSLVCLPKPFFVSQFLSQQTDKAAPVHKKVFREPLNLGSSSPKEEERFRFLETGDL